MSAQAGTGTASADIDAARIDALLPQTQCTRCGYAGCKPYAHAIAAGEADIDRCPPGGTAVIRALAELLGLAPKPLNPAYGVEGPPQVAWIDESRCIGCARCLAPCPVDAIVGAPKFLHTVIAARCTGCELCIPPCPVDCIHLEPAAPSASDLAASDQAASDQAAADQAALNRVRFEAHNTRLHGQAAQRRRELEAKKARAVDAQEP
jgi:electron transport complex protein RnfB